MIMMMMIIEEDEQKNRTDDYSYPLLLPPSCKIYNTFYGYLFVWTT